MSANESTPAGQEEILFPEGIIGVPRARRFLLLEREGSPIRVLRCLDIEGFALPVVDPRLADAGYGPRLGRHVARAIGSQDGASLLMLAVATLTPDGPTANLRAPLVINTRLRRAAQVILEERSYPLRAPLAEGTPPRNGGTAGDSPSTAVSQGQEVPDAHPRP